MNTPHPDDDTLRKFAAGLLDDDTAEQIAPHVDACTEVCQPKLDQFTSQPPEGLPDVPGLTDLVLISGGGMGVVYRAKDVALNRLVAVKILKANTSPRRAAWLAARFRKEARITGQLQHAGIPPVHELGITSDGRAYLVMKLIRGHTLAEAIGREPRDHKAVGVLVGQFEQVCQAVAYAHGHGVVHRDLKPLNVMVGSYGTVHVVDWGIAKVLGASDPDYAEETREDEPSAGTVIDPDPESDSDETEQGAVLGTAAYMPPEQAGGEIENIDQRTDVFALGAILCEILTGKSPYVGRTASAVRLMATRWEMVDGFARLDACGADPELVALAKRCLAKDPNDRPANAGEVAGVLAAMRASAEERVVREKNEKEKAAAIAIVERKRRRMQTILSAVALLVLAVGATVSTLFAFEAKDKANLESLARGRRHQDTTGAGERRKGEHQPCACAGSRSRNREGGRDRVPGRLCHLNRIGLERVRARAPQSRPEPARSLPAAAESARPARLRVVLPQAPC